MTTPQQKAAQGVVVGMAALTGDSTPRPRYDIDVLLYNNPDAFNLFLQAMSRLQQDPGLLGYYQLSGIGIHGLPTNLWDNVGKRFLTEDYGGYCAHGVLIFPTWHRPYLALLEQTIYLKMVEIAKGYNQPHQQRYLDAAKIWRLPYLDWFRPRGGSVRFPGRDNRGNFTTTFPFDFRLPDIFNVKSVTVRVAPDDTPAPLTNPLYTYKFSQQTGQLSNSDESIQVTDDGLRLMDVFPVAQTVRYPQTLRSQEHNLQRLSDTLNSGREGRTPLYLDILNSSVYGSVDTVASDRVLRKGDLTITSTPEGSSSLEAIHGNYHIFIGGNTNAVTGHMSDPTVAAFDPVFWFHHCNIDRGWAIWTAMHPNAWFPPPVDSRDKPENLKDLLPFYKAKTSSGNGTFYNSDDTKKTESFGYIYDDFTPVRAGDRQSLWSVIERKYRWSSRTPRHPNIETPPPDMAPLPVNTRYFFQPAGRGTMSTMDIGGEDLGAAPDDARPDEPIEAGTSAPDTAPDAAASSAKSVAQPHASDKGASVTGAAAAADTVVSSVMAVAQPVIEKAQAVMGIASHPKNAPAQSSTSAQVKIDPKFDREWFVDSTVRRSATNGSFTIFFFLALPGQISTNPDDYMVSPYLAGINHIFTSPRQVCDNCGRLEAAGQLASDTTPLTHLLLDYMNMPNSGLASMKPDAVKPFLVKYLRWRVVSLTAGIQDPRNVPDLDIGVSAKISHDDGSMTYEDYPDVVPEILRNASATATDITTS